MANLALKFAQSFNEVPSHVGMDLLARMDEVLHSLNAIPRGSALWESLTMGPLVLHVRDWRFSYRIDASTNKVVVEAAAPASG
jgi:hypothetical protein